MESMPLQDDYPLIAWAMISCGDVNNNFVHNISALSLVIKLL